MDFNIELYGCIYVWDAWTYILGVWTCILGSGVVFGCLNFIWDF